MNTPNLNLPTGKWRITDKTARLLFACVLACNCMSNLSQAALMLSTDVASAPLQLAPDDTGSFTVRVTSDGSADSHLSGWQFMLALAPVNGTGTVEFVVPGGLQEPADYVFPSFDATAFTETADQLGALDSVEVSGAVQVPVSPAVNLVEIQVRAAAGAVGEFGIFAVPGQFSTLWIDDTLPAPQESPFQNVPFGAAGNVQIGTIEVISSLLGDYNRDGIVNAADLSVWQTSYSMSGNGLQADGNEDSVVDGADFLIWQRQFGNTSSSLHGVMVAVPEPTTCGLLIGAVVTFWMRGEPR